MGKKGGKENSWKKFSSQRRLTLRRCQRRAAQQVLGSLVSKLRFPFCLSGVVGIIFFFFFPSISRVRISPSSTSPVHAHSTPKWAAFSRPMGLQVKFVTDAVRPATNSAAAGRYLHPTPPHTNCIFSFFLLFVCVCVCLFPKMASLSFSRTRNFSTRRQRERAHFIFIIVLR